MIAKLRRYFVAGLVATLPMFFTIYVLITVFNFLDRIIGKYIYNIAVDHLGFYVPGIGLVLFLVFTTSIAVIAGFFATKFIGRIFIPLFEKIFLRFPLSRSIYPAAKQIVQFLFTRKQFAFRRPVLIEYPRKGLYSIAFITNEGLKEACEKARTELVNLFVPNCPTPLSGYYVLIPKKDVILLDISVEEVLKLIVSGGVVNPIH